MSVTASSPSAVCDCPGCSSVLPGNGYSRSDRRYCSNACRQRAYRRRLEPNGSAADNASKYDEPDALCDHFTDEECRWTPSCNADGCWRLEAATEGKCLYGIGPTAKGGGVHSRECLTPPLPQFEGAA